MEPVDAEKLIGELEVAVDRLRSLYEQYFMGFEKLEPTVPRKDVDRRIYVLRKEQFRNTALRFRFQMLLQRYNTYQTHWQRICREIENGTYKRHVLRAQQRFADERRRRSSAPPPQPEVGSRPPPAVVVPAAPQVPVLPGLVPGHPMPPMNASMAAELAELDAEFAPPPPAAGHGFALDSEPPTLARAGAAQVPRPAGLRAGPVPREAGSPPSLRRPAPPAPRPAAPPAPPPSRPAAPAAPVARAAPAPPSAPRPGASPPQSVPRSSPDCDGDLPEARVRELYTQYVEAKRRHNESTAAITYDAVAKSLRDSQARLKEKHGRPVVDFEVGVKDGKAILRPVIK